jgi:hypothetical protein
MSKEKTAGSSAPAPPERVFVEIPRAKPGQEYRAPKNFDNPLATFVSKVVVVALCLSLPVAPGVIFAMIFAFDPNARAKFLWIWIPLTIFVMLIAFLVAFGVAREALGIAGLDKPHPRREPTKETSAETE